MDLEGLPEGVLRRHPEILPVMQALREYQEGQPVSARCPTCNKVLEVGEVNLGNVTEVWVTCGTGCTRFHEVKESSPEGHSQHG